MRSPEQVMLELPVAGPTSRILAYAIDTALMITIGFALVALVLAATPFADWLLELVGRAGEELAGEETAEPALGSAGFLLVAVFIAVQLAIEIFYFVFFETVWRGGSPGKRVLRLGVVGDDGLPVSFGASLVRNLLRSVDMLPMSYVTGLVAMLLNDRTQRLGDVAAGTLVIRYDRGRAVAPLEEAPGDEPAHVPFTREQLAHIGAVERRLLRQTLRRTAELRPDEADRLALRSARALAERMGADAPDLPSARAWLRALHAGLSRR